MIAANVTKRTSGEKKEFGLSTVNTSKSGS